MKNTKKVIALFLALSMLTACGNQGQSDSTTIAPDTTQSTTQVSTEATTSSTEVDKPKTAEIKTAELKFDISKYIASDKRPLSVAENRKKEKGIVQIFGQEKETLEENQKLVENLEFTTRQMENLDRGLVAVNNGNGNFVSWRWLGSESASVKYNLYRDGEKINAYPLNVTNYTDTLGTNDSKYQVSAIVDGIEQEKCEAVTVWADGYKEIQLVNRPVAVEKDGTPKEGVVYTPNDISTGDLDGDGELELVLKWDPSDAKDNSQKGLTSPVILDAYKLDGTFMWRINLGYNIRAGAHYTQFMVYDLDGDGKAEIVCKTADGTTDALGTVIGDANADYRNDGSKNSKLLGTVLEGPEYLTVFEGATGKILDTVDYEVARGNTNDWGDNYGNRSERYLACVAYLNGVTPSVVMCRGYYARSSMVAYDFKDGKLQKLWTFDTNDDGNSAFRSQGNHSIAVADVDMDGKDEIVYGSAVIDDDGTPVYSTGLGHGDAQHTGDLIPDRPGLEVFSVHEDKNSAFGIEMRDARTGEILWGSYENSDVGRGVSDDIDPNYPGAESWASGKMIASDGTVIFENPTISSNFLIYWDGDLGREIQDGNHIDKWVSEKNTTKVLELYKDYTTANGTKSTPGLTCDLLGDWREETVLFKNDGNSITIFTTTIPTDYKLYTLMHDSQYRTYIATQNVAYNQPAHIGYYLGFETEAVPVPRVKWTENGKEITNPDLENGIKYYSIDALMRDESIALVINNNYALVNDNMQRVDSEDNKVAPYLSGLETFVPISFVSEAFGVDASAEKGSKTIKIDGKEYTLSAPAELTEEKICVPLKSVAEALGKTMIFDSTGLVYVSDNTEKPEQSIINNFVNIIKNYVEPKDSSSNTTISTEAARARRIEVVGVTASSDDGNVAAGAVDNDFETRWNAWDDNALLTIDLGQSTDIAAIAATFFKGNERFYYFDIQVSNDGQNWETVLEAQESPVTVDKELAIFKFPEVKNARYVQYVGHNSSANNANNIWELMVLSPEK